jgi:predicted cobalt transporter CbtA
MNVTLKVLGVVGYGILVVRGFVSLLAELIGTCLFLLQANPIALHVETTGSPETVTKRTRSLVAPSPSCDPILVEIVYMVVVTQQLYYNGHIHT